MGKQLVWQCDDDLWHIPNWNPASKLLKIEDLEATGWYINNCKKLWVSTSELAELVGHPDKTLVLPNLIDLNQFDDKIIRTEEVIKIVWCGSASHDKDLDVIIEPIIKLLEKFKNKIAVIFWGYLPTGLGRFDRQPGFSFAQIVPKHENLFYGEWFSNREYFHKLRELKPDIAIMPLDDCEFNKSKSNLKFLEMSMAGAACIGTNLPPYGCIKHGETGLLVDANDQIGWYDALEELIKNKEYRLNLNNAAREQIRNEYCWQSSAAELWLQAFLDLIPHRQT
jgi:glycosyltransferase involved in cell wall biosynthesis